MLADCERQPFTTVYHSPVNFGKGAAIRVGLAKCRGDIILIQDGDLEYDPRDYRAVLAPIVAGEADVVFGSRFFCAASAGCASGTGSQTRY